MLFFSDILLPIRHDVKKNIQFNDINNSLEDLSKLIEKNIFLKTKIFFCKLFIRKYFFTVYHSTGKCQMKDEEDPIRLHHLSKVYVLLMQILQLEKEQQILLK